jgi:hypothetical protein
MKRKKSIPNLIEASRTTATEAEDWNNQVYKVGANNPKTVGPMIMPPIISPNTAGWCILRMNCPNINAHASMVVI